MYGKTFKVLYPKVFYLLIKIFFLELLVHFHSKGTTELQVKTIVCSDYQVDV
jgi:hypothetical protein